jgi:hypothetical protein
MVAMMNVSLCVRGRAAHQYTPHGRGRKGELAPSDFDHFAGFKRRAGACSWAWERNHGRAFDTDTDSDPAPDQENIPRNPGSAIQADVLRHVASHRHRGSLYGAWPTVSTG